MAYDWLYYSESEIFFQLEEFKTFDNYFMTLISYDNKWFLLKLS